jgi:acyl-CoA dehydrogenase
MTMEFAFTAEQDDLRRHISDLLDKVCPPDYAKRCDDEMTPPREAFQALAEHGWFGLILPPEHGGSGGSSIDLAIALEEIGRHYEELAMWFFRTLTYGAYAILRDGSEKQKRELLPRILSGEISFCFGLTEPHSGSDAAALTTRAVRDGDHYIINGQKVFTSGMDISDYCLLVARTSTGEKKQQGITTFLIDTKTPGIDAYLWYERLCLSAARTGAALAAFDYALRYAKERKQFGKTIGSYQAISHKLADMKVMLDVSRLLVYRFAWSMAQGQATRTDAAVLKLCSGETYKAVSDLGLQILGGYGYCMEYPMQRFFRDSRLAVIGGGTSEIQRNIIARGLGL